MPLIAVPRTIGSSGLLESLWSESIFGTCTNAWLTMHSFRDDVRGLNTSQPRAGEIVMLRLVKIVFAFAAATASLSQATAHEWICPDGACFPGDYGPGYPIGRAHKFYPRLRDGLPLVNDFRDAPAGYHGAGCVWTRERVMTRQGLVVWAMVPYCLDY
jgi:hypothetical protein